LAQHKFREFLQSRRPNDWLDRRFVGHALGDGRLPDAGSWRQLETYLNECEAGPEALRAARYVWEQYANKSSATPKTETVSGNVGEAPPRSCRPPTEPSLHGCLADRLERSTSVVG
jgi:hypothetical protein